MKPFNLEEALAGKPVVTRDGKPVTQLTLFHIKNEYPLVGVINQERHSFNKKGVHLLDWETNLDLFMAPEKKTGWVNIYRGGKGRVYTGQTVSETKEKAAERSSANVLFRRLVDTIQIEWEE